MKQVVWEVNIHRHNHQRNPVENVVQFRKPHQQRQHTGAEHQSRWQKDECASVHEHDELMPEKPLQSCTSLHFVNPIVDCVVIGANHRQLNYVVEVCSAHRTLLCFQPVRALLAHEMLRCAATIGHTGHQWWTLGVTLLVADNT
jgi:hypothetical protein